MGKNWKRWLSEIMVGCLWGGLGGTALTAGFLKLITSRRAHPYDEVAYGVIFAVALLLALVVWVADMLCNEETYSFRRFAFEVGTAILVVLPATVPAYFLMAFFEGILSRFVS